MLKAGIKKLPRQYFERICCVYFICVENEIVYIGKTVNLHLRVASHHRLSIPDMDEIKYFEVPEKELSLTEKALIRYFAPERNGLHTISILLNPDEVEKEVEVVNRYIENPEFSASKHVSQLCHSMYIKHGYEKYKRAYNMYADKFELSQTKKVIEMKRTLR